MNYQRLFMHILLISLCTFVLTFFIYLMVPSKKNLHIPSTSQQLFSGYDETQTLKNGSAEIVIYGFSLQEMFPHSAYTFTLHAQKSKIFRSKKMMQCHNMSCTISDEQNTLVLFNAGNATINQETKSMHMRDGVRTEFLYRSTRNHSRD